MDARGEARIRVQSSGRTFLPPYFPWPVPTLSGLPWRTAPSTGPILSMLCPRLGQHLSSVLPLHPGCASVLSLITLHYTGPAGCLPSPVSSKSLGGRAWVQQKFVKWIGSSLGLLLHLTLVISTRAPRHPTETEP